MRTRLCAVAVAAAVIAVMVAMRTGDAPETSSGVRALAAAPSLRGWQRVDPTTLPGVELRGRVGEVGGAAIAGARVCAFAASAQLTPEQMRAPSCTTTGLDGGYVLVDLVAANHTVEASAPGFVPGAWRDHDGFEEVVVAAGERRAGIDIVLRRGGVELHGRVVDIGGGAVVGALVTAWSQRDGESPAMAVAFSGRAGEFKTWIAPGQVTARAEADGYAANYADGLAPANSLTILLTPESVLAGRVVRAGTNAPVAGVLVSSGSDDPFVDDGGAFTDRAGHFRITRLSPGRYKPIARAAGAYGEAATSVALGLGQTHDGSVIEVHGAFAVGGRVLVDGDEARPCRRGVVRLVDREADRSAHAVVDSEGQVRLLGVLPGDYAVSVLCRGFLAEERYPRVLVSDRDVIGARWPVAAGASIRGEVSAAGQPAAGASVNAVAVGDPRQRNSDASTVVDAAGGFALTGLVGGDYKLSVEADDFADLSEAVDVSVAPGGEARVAITLGEAATVNGVVVDEDGVGVGGIEVEARGDRRGWATASVGDDGRFTLRGLEPDDYRVVASLELGDALRAPAASDDDVRGQRVRVVAGQVAEVRLVVENRAGVIRGRVVDERGKAIGDAFVAVERESEASGAVPGEARRWVRYSWTRPPVLTDLAGGFAVTELSPGSYTVRVHRRGGGESIAEHVAVGANLTMTIAPTAHLSGTVTCGGVAVEEFTISVVDEDSGYYRSEHFFRTGARWTLAGLPAGELAVAAETNLGTARVVVVLSSGERKSGVDLTLDARTRIVGRTVDLDSGEPVAGMDVIVEPVEVGVDAVYEGQDRKHISDAEGRFEIANVPAGHVYVIAIARDLGHGTHTFARTAAVAAPGGTHDIGDLPVPRLYLAANERPGDFGFDLSAHAPGLAPEAQRQLVSRIRADGPALGKLEVGDEIISADGHDVRARTFLLEALLIRPVGAAIVLGLARGPTVTITAASPP